MQFIFIDRVLELACMRRIVAVRQMTSAEDIFKQHFPGNPMLPASLVVEACAQAATILLEASGRFERKAFVGFVERAKFRTPIRPGHEMQIELEVRQEGEDGALLGGKVHQCGRRCATIELGMATAPMSDFFQPHQLPYYLDLYRPWLAETELEGFERHPLKELGNGRV